MMWSFELSLSPGRALFTLSLNTGLAFEPEPSLIPPLQRWRCLCLDSMLGLIFVLRSSKIVRFWSKNCKASFFAQIAEKYEIKFATVRKKIVTFLRWTFWNSSTVIFESPLHRLPAHSGQIGKKLNEKPWKRLATHWTKIKLFTDQFYFLAAEALQSK